jgi:phenylacetate-CoA ligase
MSERHAVARRFFDLMAESQFWTPQRLRDYQHTELRQLLDFVMAEVPFYRDRLAVLFGSDGGPDWGRWHEVPILTRAELAAHGHSLLPKQPPPNHGAISTFTTSGSTGVAVETRHTQLAAEAWTAAHWRAQRWWGTDWSAPLVHWHHIETGGQAPDPDHAAGPWGNPDIAEARDGVQFTINRRLPVEELFAHLSRHRVKYLSVPALNAFAVAEEALARGLSASLDGIFSFSLGAEPEHREACHRAFGAPIRDLYSSKEAGFIAHACVSGEHYHVNAEFALVEILDGAGHPCRPGEIGRVVVTPFLSTAQPLIRYEQGDMARQGEPAGTCACGVMLPMIAAIAGRAYHMFRLPGGRRIVPALPDPARLLLGACSWQIAQVGPALLEIRYVADTDASEEARVKVQRQVRDNIDPGFDVRFARIGAVPLTAAGKYLKYVCELP